MSTRNTSPLEHAEQVALFEWAHVAIGAHPELRLMYAIPNGGRRSAITGARLRAEGVKPGVPDICLPAVCRTYCGLYIELKRRKGGVVTPQQRWWLTALQAAGYRAEVCDGWTDARDVILHYLGAM